MNFLRFHALVVLSIALFCGVSHADARPSQKSLDVALLAAVEENDLQRVQYSLARGADVNARDGDGNTALILASFVGDPKNELMRVHPIAFMQLLLKHGADVNLRAGDGETALMRAAQGGPPAVRLLLDKGARINAQTDAGETALMRAVSWECEGPCTDLDSVRLLLRRGANPNFVTINGETALMRAAQLTFYGPLTAKDGMAAAQMLLARGADVTARTRNGNTALLWAKAGGNRNFIGLIERAETKR